MSKVTRAANSTASFVDDRTSIGGFVKFFSRKLFPDHWSFLLGEVALYSFIVLLITGVFMTGYFIPSAEQTVYDGSFATMQGVEMSQAFQSTLHLSFDVRGGLLIRQIHHWSALMFTAAIMMHMLRVFFTGAFRKPRDINWLVGFGLLTLSLAAGFSGYSLPDDVLSGNGLRILDGVVKSIPVLGTRISYWMFGGEFPGDALIPRLYTLHVLLVPAAILGLVGLHLFLVFLHKHTQYPGGGRTHKNVVGLPLFPVYVAKAGGFFFVVFGVLTLLGALMTINPIWNYGPYDPSPVSAGAQPDWYMLFLEGALRLTPGFLDFSIGGWDVPMNVLLPGVLLPGIIFTLQAIYPFVEAWATGDRGERHVLDRPRNVPVRTSIGAALIAFYAVLMLAGSNDILATTFHMSINTLTNTFRVLIFVLPIAAFWVTKRVCFGLQRKDRELALHGHETGRIVRTESGEYIEVHQPLSEQELWLAVGHDNLTPIEIEPKTNERGVKRPGYRWDRFRQALSRFYYEDRVEPVTPAELAAAADEHH